MKLIDRESFLNRLTRLKWTPDIKVITGVRRSGKSKLLEEYICWIRDNEVDFNIIFIDLTNLKFEELKEYHNEIDDDDLNNRERMLFIYFGGADAGDDVLLRVEDRAGDVHPGPGRPGRITGVAGYRSRVCRPVQSYHCGRP